MMQTLNSQSTARTAEIMARYRPIAPKPDMAASASPVGRDGENSVNSPASSNSIPQSVQNSPYLMNVWPNLQSRPSRTRKRGRTTLAPSVKRSRTCLQGLSPPYQVTAPHPPVEPLGLKGFVNDPNGIPQIAFLNPSLLSLNCGMESPMAAINSISTVTLPSFVPCGAPITPPGATDGLGAGFIDLSIYADQELNFMPQIQSSTVVNVIAPLPVRPVGSSITVGRIGDDSSTGRVRKQVVKKSEEVEKEMESEAFPVVVSDSNNKVRLTNSAYNEMVGQPECCWLDCMSCGRGGGGGGGGGSNACKRIGGEVLIEFSDSEVPLLSSKGFTCWVRIEWGNDENKRVVNAFCDAIRLACSDSKDYVFEWRFHPTETSVTSNSGDFSL